MDENQTNLNSTTIFQLQQARLGERMATLEAGYTGLKEDTTIIRGWIHDTNNKMQVFMAAEQRCATALEALTDAHTEMKSSLGDLTKIVQDLINSKSQAEGAWWGITKVALVIGVMFSIIGTLAVTVNWILSHFSISMVKPGG